MRKQELKRVRRGYQECQGQERRLRLLREEGELELEERVRWVLPARLRREEQRGMQDVIWNRQWKEGV